MASRSVPKDFDIFLDYFVNDLRDMIEEEVDPFFNLARSEYVEAYRALYKKLKENPEKFLRSPECPADRRLRKLMLQILTGEDPSAYRKAKEALEDGLRPEVFMQAHGLLVQNPLDFTPKDGPILHVVLDPFPKPVREVQEELEFDPPFDALDRAGKLQQFLDWLIDEYPLLVQKVEDIILKDFQGFVKREFLGGLLWGIGYKISDGRVEQKLGKVNVRLSDILPMVDVSFQGLKEFGTPRVPIGVARFLEIAEEKAEELSEDATTEYSIEFWGEFMYRVQEELGDQLEEAAERFLG